MDNKRDGEENLTTNQNTDPSLDHSAEERSEELNNLEGLEKENKDLKDQLVRSLADYQNLSKRVQKERKEWSLYAAEPVLKAISPALENFYYALSSEEKNQNSDFNESNLLEERKKSLESFRAIYQSFFSCLAQIGFSEIRPELGENFDPSLHEAITSIESEYPVDSICQVYRPGMLLNKKVIKPAQVTLSKGQKNQNNLNQDSQI